MPVIIDGTNGVSTPNTFAFKNRLINSQLLINQRGVSGTVSLSAGAYGHDRFKAGASGCTYTFATSNNVTTLTITAGSLQQVIEGLNLESGTYTLSWTGTAQGKIGAGSYGASGITGSITGGTNTTIEFNTGTLSLPQLEKGSTATSFDYRPYGTELALCQRYYEIVSQATGYVSNTSWTSAFVNCIFQVQKRTAPSAPPIVGTISGQNYAGTNPTATATSIYGAAQTYGCQLSVTMTGATGTVSLGSSAILFINTGTGGFGFSAEL
jgi:hypothetical protein